MKALLRTLATFFRELHWGAVCWASLATALLAVLIVVGSRNLQDFDSALIGYTFACLFTTFGLVYRYAVWLSKPPTRKYWRRGWQLFFSPRLWKNLRSPKVFGQALWSKILAQDFILRRNLWRWMGHMLLAWGCILAAAITFPLVFGWIHFEQGSIDPPAYVPVVFGFHMPEIPIGGVFAWFVFHGLVIASFMVIPGVMILMHRRMTDDAAMAVQRFGRDFLPLILLWAIAFTGLLLWVSYEWLDGYYYGALAQFHAFTVIGTLIYLPFGKLFHIFQRPATLGISYYKAANADRSPAVCPVTRQGFAPKMQTDDLNEVLRQLEFHYESPAKSKAPNWNEISPKGRRMLIGRAHAKADHARWPGAAVGYDPRAFSGGDGSGKTVK